MDTLRLELFIHDWPVHLILLFCSTKLPNFFTTFLLATQTHIKNLDKVHPRIILGNSLDSMSYRSSYFLSTLTDNLFCCCLFYLKNKMHEIFFLWASMIVNLFYFIVLIHQIYLFLERIYQIYKFCEKLAGWMDKNGECSCWKFQEGEKRRDIQRHRLKCNFQNEMISLMIFLQFVIE